MPFIELNPEVEHAHRRLDDIERRLQRFNNPSPTVPQYDLQAAVTGIIFVSSDQHSVDASRISTSEDGITWTPAVDPTYAGNFGYAVAWSPALQLWVAVCDDDYLTSPDGVTWTANNLEAPSEDVVWCDSLGLFVTCGFFPFASPPLIMTSSDGLTWTGQTTPWDGIPGTINGLGWSHDLGQILACGTDNSGGPCFMTSPNAVTWTIRSTPADGGFGYYRAAWSGSLGLWAATGIGGDGGLIMTSLDGINWTTRYSHGGTGQGTDVCWAESLGIFLVAGSSLTGTDAFATSSDGITWTTHTAPWGTVDGVAWSQSLGLFAAVQAGTSGVLTSPDGITWTAQSASLRGDRLAARA